MRDNTFGDLLRERRKQCGLSQFQLGEMLHVSDKAVSKWENNLARPKSHLLYRLSIILGITVDELLSGSENSAIITSSCLNSEKKAELWQIAYNRMLKLYNNEPPLEVISRFENEKLALRNSDMMLFFDLLSKISSVASEKGYPIHLRGGIGASFVAYLMNVTDINPLPAHYYCPICKVVEFVPDICDGWELPQKCCAKCHSYLERDGHNIPFEIYRHIIGNHSGFGLLVSRYFWDEAETMIMQYFRKDSVIILEPPSHVLLDQHISKMKTYVITPKRVQETDDSDIRDYREYYETLSDMPYINLMLDAEYEKYITLQKKSSVQGKEIDILEDEVINAIVSGNLEGILPNQLQSLPLLYDKFPVKTWRNVLQLLGMALNISAISEEEAISYIDIQSGAIHKFAYRDDVYLYLCSEIRKQGCYDFGLAYMVMDRTRKGRYYHKGIDKHTRKLLLDIGVSEEYIACLEGTSYLFPKAQGVTHIKHVMELIWYRIHYPQEFQATILQDTNDSL